MKKQLLFFSFLLAGLCLFSCGKDDDTVDDPPTPPAPDLCDSLSVSFATDIEPIITATCAIEGCHVAGFGSGDFTAYEGIKEKVDDDNKFVTRILDESMPPSTTSGPTSLTEAEIEKIECWVDDGALDN